jgi:hypothetical protein
MVRKSAILLMSTLIFALPAFSHPRPGLETPTQTALHLMNDGEFTLFLQRLDIELGAAKSSFKSVQVRSLGGQKMERKGLEQSYQLCLAAMDNTQEEIQKLEQKQTLKLDFLLLIDLNELTRDLDRLDSNLANPVTVNRAASRKSFVYARQVLGIDAALAPRVAEFQQHVLAFAGVVDASLGQVVVEDSEPSPGLDPQGKD